MNTSIVTIGTQIYSSLRGSAGTVYAIHGEQSPETCRTLCGVVSAGGSAEFSIVFISPAATTRIPESIARGVQWQIRDDLPLMPEGAIANMILAAEEAKEHAEKERVKAVLAFEASKECLRTSADYSHFVQGGKGVSMSCGVLAAKNIRIALKKAFPGIHFSVKKDGYGTVRVNWIDGPPVKVVDDLVQRHKEGDFDGMDDCYKYAKNAFAEVFGSAKYVFTTRRFSPLASAKILKAVNLDPASRVCDLDWNDRRKFYDEANDSFL